LVESPFFDGGLLMQLCNRQARQADLVGFFTACFVWRMRATEKWKYGNMEVPLWFSGAAKKFV
jgi:hypothetical protein